MAGSSNLCVDHVYKDQQFFKAEIKENLKYFLCNRYTETAFNFLLILLLATKTHFFKKSKTKIT